MNEPQALPYAGLRPFLREETDIFFGREQHTNELLELLGKQQFVAVIGYSGCGKSSLVKTGLIASLQAGFLSNVSADWKIAEMRPSNQPFQQLAEALVQPDVLGDSYSPALVENEALTRSPFSLHELLAVKPLPSQSKLLIVCDQFEEIFRYHKQGAKAEAIAFVDLLLASCAPYPLPTGEMSNDIYVVLTMRSDFLGDCALFSGLAEVINKGLYLTPRLNREQLRAAIEEPARVFGGSVEPALVVTLLEDAEHNPDQLPLLQHALMLMWLLAVKEQPDAPNITKAHYESIGSLKQALSKHADHIFKHLNHEQQEICERMFKALCERGESQRDTRRPQALSALLGVCQSDFDSLLEVIDIFRHPDCCFLVPPFSVDLDGDKVIDISHESLIRHWQRLQDWVNAEAESAKIYLRLEDRAKAYESNETNLLQSPELEVFQQWYEKEKPTEAWAKRYGHDFGLMWHFLSESEHGKREALLQKTQARLERIRLQRKVNRTLRYSLFGAVMSVVALSAYVAYYKYAFVRENVRYCHKAVKSFGVLQCVGLVSKDAIKNRKVTYKFIRHGAFNLPHKVVAIDANHQCTDEHSLRSYLATENRQTVKADKPDNTKLNVKNNSSIKENNSTLKECQWEFILNDKQRVVYEKAFDKDNKLVWGLTYSPDNKSENNKAKAFFVGANGFPQSPKNSKAEFVKFRYSDLGYEVGTSYFDRLGNRQVKDGNNYHEVIAEHDAVGNIVKQTFWTLSTEKATHKDGYHRWKSKYDEQGNEIEKAYFDSNEHPVFHADGYHQWEAKYDEKGNQIETRLFDIDNQATFHKDGYHKITSKYDNKSKVIEVAYFGLNNKATLNKYSIHKGTIKYDGKGNQIESAYFGLNNQAILDKYGIHKGTTKYDEKGNQIESAYFGLNNQAILFLKLYHKITHKYDEKGKKIEEAYFGLSNQAVLYAGNVHKMTYKYDEKGNQIEIDFFGLNNQAILLHGAYHKTIYKYDEKGNQIEEAYFGLNNQAILYTGNVHKIAYKYDKKGNKIEENYFSLNNQTILNENGVHKKTWKYNKNGNRIEAAYFGLNNQAILDKDGIHKKTVKHDKKINLIEVAYFDLENKPVLDIATLITKASDFFHQKDYQQAEELYKEGLIKFPNDLTLLSNDAELALVQNNLTRFKQRLETIQAQITPNTQYLAIMAFLNYLADTQQDYQIVLNAIEQTEKTVEFTWDFSDIEPAIERQTETTQQQARLFIKYFKKEIDLTSLKQQLQKLKGYKIKTEPRTGRKPQKATL